MGSNRTKEERFVLCLHKEAMRCGDEEMALDRYDIGVKAVLSAKAVDAICQQLVRANFIRKEGEQFICLTRHGLRLALELASE